jgi:hypothetical protein
MVVDAEHLAITTDIAFFCVGSELELLVPMPVLLNAQQMESWLMANVYDRVVVGQQLVDVERRRCVSKR